MSKHKDPGTGRPTGPAVADEDPDYSPMRDDRPGKPGPQERETDASKRLKRDVQRDIERPQKGSA